MSNTSTIEVYSDYVCPWCYLHSAALATLEQNHPVTLRWRAFPLHAETPREGMPLTELFGGRDMSAAQAHLEALIDEAGLEYNYCDMTYNTRLAQELGKWAETQKGGKALHQALFRAYFVRGRNLAEESVLLDAVVEAGLDKDAANSVIRDRSFSEAVDTDWRQARQQGISGVPCTIAGGYMLSGYQPYPELERFTRFI